LFQQKPQQRELYRANAVAINLARIPAHVPLNLQKLVQHLGSEGQVGVVHRSPHHFDAENFLKEYFLVEEYTVLRRLSTGYSTAAPTLPVYLALASSVYGVIGEAWQTQMYHPVEPSL
jgi:hypothetical protein